MRKSEDIVSSSSMTDCIFIITDESSKDSAGKISFGVSPTSMLPIGIPLLGCHYSQIVIFSALIPADTFL
jgi:hypothetical protein